LFDGSFFTFRFSASVRISFKSFSIFYIAMSFFLCSILSIFSPIFNLLICFLIFCLKTLLCGCTLLIHRFYSRTPFDTIIFISVLKLFQFLFKNNFINNHIFNGFNFYLLFEDNFPQLYDLLDFSPSFDSNAFDFFSLSFHFLF
jgi:hypothetical protein